LNAPSAIMISILSLVLLPCSAGVGSYSQPVPVHCLEATGVDLVIDYGNSTQQVFEDLSGFTVFDVLNSTVNVTYTQYSYGKFIESINGVANNAGGNGYYWQYWVNGELGPVAADYYVLSDGDQVLWRYCPPSFPQNPPSQVDPQQVIGLLIVAGSAGVALCAALLVNRKMR